MNESIRLGRVGSVRIGANWSLLPVAALLTWSLATYQYPASAPGYPAGAYWLAAAATSACFFAGLAAHELAHALVARHFGVRVRGIVLWLFGGVAQLEGDAATPRAEGRIAAAGPAASLGLAAGFGALGYLVHASGSSGLLGVVLGWLAWINLVLAGFNLLPAFPLDGGRVLRAVLWRHWGHKLRATTAAARVGRGIGSLLVAAGLLEFLGLGGAFGGLWLALVGMFIVSAAGAQLRAVQADSELAGLAVRDAMSPNPVVAPAWVSVQDLVERWFAPTQLPAFPLAQPDGRLVGLVSAERVRAVPFHLRPSTPALEVACPLAQVATTTPEEPLSSLAPRLAASPDRLALVMEAGRLVGVISLGDVERARRRAGLFGSPRRSAAGVV